MRIRPPLGSPGFFLLALLSASVSARAQDAGDWKRYSNAALGVSIEAPADWSMRAVPDQGRLDLLDPQYERTRSGISLSVLPVPFSEDLFKRWRESLKQEDATASFESEDDLRIGGARAHQIVFVGNPPGGAQKHQMVFIEGPGKVYSLECSSREAFFKTFQGFCARAAASFAPVGQAASSLGWEKSADGGFSIQIAPGWENVTSLHQAQFKDTVLAVQSPRGMVNIRRVDRGTGQAPLSPEEIKSILASEAQGAVDKGAKFLSSQISVLPNGLNLYYVTLLEPSGQETILSGIFQAGARAYRVAGVAPGGDPLQPLELAGDILKTYRAETPETALAPPGEPASLPAQAGPSASAEEAPAPARPPRKTPATVKFMLTGAILSALALGLAALYSAGRSTWSQAKTKKR